MVGSQGSMHARLTWVPTHNPVVGAEGTTESSATTSSTMVSMTPGQDVNVRNHYRHIEVLVVVSIFFNYCLMNHSLPVWGGVPL